MEQITIPAQLDHIESLYKFVCDTLEESGLGNPQLNKINLAIEEIYTNIVNYAYPDKDGNVTISVSSEPDRILIEFKDTGIPYNPLEKIDPDISLSADERVIGGLGIFMVKRIMDDVLYRYEDGQNILTLIKNV